MIYDFKKPVEMMPVKLQEHFLIVYKKALDTVHCKNRELQAIKKQLLRIGEREREGCC